MAKPPAPARAPGVCQLIPLPYGALGHSRRDPLGFLLEGMRRHGDVFRYRLGPFLFHQLAHPDHVRHVLVDRARNYRRSRHYARTKLIVGEGLVTTEGEAWRRLRSLSQPAFHPQRVANLAGMVTDACASMLERWSGLAQSETVLDLAQEFVRLTLRIAGRALLGVDLDGESDRIVRAVTTLLEYGEYRITSLLPMPFFSPTPFHRRFRRERRALDSILYAMIEARKRTPGKLGDDLMSRLMSARDEATGEGFTDVELRNQILTFIAAGHETTAVGLGWTVYLLARDPDWWRLVEEEIDRVLAGRVPAAEDLPHLDRCRRVVEESLRLYPPVFGVVREVVERDEIGGFMLPARSMVILSPYVTHRHPEFWPDAERFDPDRFLPEQVDRRPRHAWFPFLGGPHRCIGQEFAMMELILSLAMIAQRFRVFLVPGSTVVPKPMLTLRTRSGIPVRLQSRRQLV